MLNTYTNVRCLLIPINGRQLLLPTAVIAEVFSYNEAERVADNQPNWLLGVINWRKQRVPLLSIEDALSLTSMTNADSEPKYRTVILYGLESSQTMPFYAFRAIDVPRSLTVTEKSLTHFSAETRAGVAFHVTIDEQNQAWLPDVVYLETLLRKSPLLSRPT